MFNLLVSGCVSAWDTGQPWSMPFERFKEYSGSEASGVSAKQPQTLKVIEEVPALLMYEWGVSGINADVVRFGYVENIRTAGRSLLFNFREESHCDRDLVDEFATWLSLGDWERNRTHWAIKDGVIPRDMLQQMIQGSYRKFRYEVVLSYAGEDHAYVERVAKYLKEREIELFFAPFKEADLWGTNLSEELDIIYRMEGRYCVMFLSKNYAKKAWPTHERRSAMSRAVQQQGRYILPCRFDDTEIPGLPPSTSYVDLNTKTAEQLGELIMEVLGRKRHLGTYQPGDNQLEQVRELARRMSEVSGREAEAVVVELQQIFASASEPAVAQEALFRVTLAELPSSNGWLFSIADDVERPFVLRQRAMIGLCKTLRHDHPSASDDGQGTWIRWWTESRDALAAEVRSISRI